MARAIRPPGVVVDPADEVRDAVVGGPGGDHLAATPAVPAAARPGGPAAGRDCRHSGEPGQAKREQEPRGGELFKQHDGGVNGRDHGPLPRHAAGRGGVIVGGRALELVTGEDVTQGPGVIGGRGGAAAGAQVQHLGRVQAAEVDDDDQARGGQVDGAFWLIGVGMLSDLPRLFSLACSVVLYCALLSANASYGWDYQRSFLGRPVAALWCCTPAT
jgi:hypothetical protein